MLKGRKKKKLKRNRERQRVGERKRERREIYRATILSNSTPYQSHEYRIRGFNVYQCLVFRNLIFFLSITHAENSSITSVPGPVTEERCVKQSKPLTKWSSIRIALYRSAPVLRSSSSFFFPPSPFTPIIPPRLNVFENLLPLRN